MYTWQDPDWPRFRQDPALLADRLAAMRKVGCWGAWRRLDSRLEAKPSFAH